MIPANYWSSVNTSLAITKEGLDPEFVSKTLGFPEPTSNGAVINSGPNWWAYTYDESFTGGLEEQVHSLTSQIAPRLDRVAILSKTSHAVQVAIAGTVETGSRLFVSPIALGQLASLGVPISFTSLTAQGMPDEDPLSWLD